MTSTAAKAVEGVKAAKAVEGVRAVRAVKAAQHGKSLRTATKGGFYGGADDSLRAVVGGALDGGQRQQVIDTLIAVLGGAYAHLPAKRAAYAVDPVQALALLRRRAADLTDADFHLAVTGIVTGLRDAHTRYVGPVALRGQVAALPFLVEQYGAYDDPTFVVTKTADGVSGIDGTFAPGVRLRWWNAIPMARAVEVYADRETGGRPDARRARALESLTFRALDYGPPPDEHWVDVGYLTSRGAAREIRLPWRVLAPGKAGTAVRPGSRAQLKQAADPAAEAVRRAKKLLFAPALWAAEDAAPTPASGYGATRTPGAARSERTSSALAAPLPTTGTSGPRPAVGESIPTAFQDALSAQRIGPTLGQLRIWSFDVDHDDAFLDEVTRLLGLLPPEQLVVDLRGNPGGLVWAAERLLQLFTDHPILPTRFQLVASALTREMAANPFNRLELEAWSASLDEAISTGEQYAQPLPLTDPQWCNDRGRTYTGRAVAVVDANTYSSGDLFAAGWVDNDIGPLVTVGQATGAGGANVWTGDQLRDSLSGTDHAYQQLPAGVGFTIAIRRAIRSGLSDGIPIEDLGVAGTPYAMTRDDLLKSNRDLHAFCVSLMTD